MSRGMPSMTALLGLLALAGYQNRDKLADLLKGASNSNAQPGTSSQHGPLGGLLGNLSGVLAGGGVGGLLSGGLGELLERFKQNERCQYGLHFIEAFFGPIYIEVDTALRRHLLISMNVELRRPLPFCWLTCRANLFFDLSQHQT
jgi:hypothetical protein